MTVTDETIMAIRMRIERLAMDMLWQNPETDDPKAVRLVRRIERIKRWAGDDAWDLLNQRVLLRMQTQ